MFLLPISTFSSTSVATERKRMRVRSNRTKETRKKERRNQEEEYIKIHLNSMD